ncbi:hypothetical protein THIAE_05690 [Thiomicrospira aerophila AL3]|uniref:Uncharacterized protein n=1 Tax=Thiomicrospira aerophila AL3 TaxID=717772 RepID=W0DUZ4_9GAMM|nr:hypothetical protein [Thiomicrospira aerophila]AHF02252.1 hypothetical protein THIAE_05690 [Thiomicrospira aerophila AL3]
MSNESSSSLSIVVNRNGLIESLSSNWLDNLDEVTKKALDSSHLIGQPLSIFIRNDSTKMYVESCIQLCRVSKKVITRPYRCDSPTHKRFMELELVPLQNGSVLMNHLLLKVEAFVNRLDIVERVDNRPKKHSGLVRCSFCNKLRRVGEKEWFEPERLVSHTAQNIAVIHSVCPACTQANWTHKS